MHRYDHHIGDYDRDTSHLTLLEHGVYRRLLDRMYADERPLDLDLKKVGRKLNARTKPEREALALVIEEFFERRDTGFHHKRVERELGQIETRVLQSQYGMVRRYWKPQEMGKEPTFEEFRAHPERYRNPATGHIGNYYRPSSGLQEDKPNGNSYHRPPTTDHRPPTTDHVKEPPVVPQGGRVGSDESAEEELELNSLNPDREDSEKKERGAALMRLRLKQAEEIYALYPRKIGKDKALSAIAKRLKEGLPPEDLMVAVRNYARCVAKWPDDRLRFVPHPATWFNQARYDDNPEEWLREVEAGGPKKERAGGDVMPPPSVLLTAPDGWRAVYEQVFGREPALGWTALSGEERSEVMDAMEMEGGPS